MSELDLIVLACLALLVAVISYIKLAYYKGFHDGRTEANEARREIGPENWVGAKRRSSDKD